MSGSVRMSGEAFAIARLQENPNLDYASLRAMANEAGVAIAPIQYGRARRHLGLPPMKDKPEPVNVRKPIVPEMRELPTPVAADDHDDAPVEEPADEPASAPTGARVDLVAPRRKGSAAFDFLVQELRKDGALSYGELKNRAEGMGFKIAPIMYGRAKAVLGLVPVRPRGSGKATAPKPTAPLSLKQVESVAADRFTKHLAQVQSTEQLITAVKDIDNERRRLRQLLEKIVALIDEALG